MPNIRVFIANKKLRGFFKQLLNNPPEGIDFVNNSIDDESIFFEKKSYWIRLLSDIWSSWLGNYLGLIQRVNISNSNCDVVETYNRFANTNGKPYLIYLENPTALYHYVLKRAQTKIGNRKIRLFLSDKNLKDIVCMSQACKDTLEQVLGEKIPDHIQVHTNYPVVPLNPLISAERIKEKANEKVLKLLFISSEFMMKGGPEIIRAIQNLSSLPINTTIITDPATIDSDSMAIINTMDKQQLTLFPFNQSFEQLQALNNECHLLLHPTSKDSFGLTVLEALKSGLPVIGTNLYAIPEMVENEKNGFLTSPPIPYFTKDNLPNPLYWKKDRVLNERPLDQHLVSFLTEKITYYYNNRSVLYLHSLNSWEKASSPPFETNYVIKKWGEIYASTLST